jgi:hypothetical protein
MIKRSRWHLARLHPSPLTHDFSPDNRWLMEVASNGAMRLYDRTKATTPPIELFGYTGLL